MSLEKALVILRTVGFISELSEDAQVKVMEYSLARINMKTDMIALDPKCEENRLEDDGRTLIAVNPWSQKKIYVKLDDFGDPATWNEIYDKETVEELRRARRILLMRTRRHANACMSPELIFKHSQRRHHSAQS